MKSAAKKEIKLYGEKYLLLGFIIQPYQNHFVSYFKNYNQVYNKSLNMPFKCDYINGYSEKVNNDFIALDNISSNEGLSLFVHAKTTQEMKIDTLNLTLI